MSEELQPATEQELPFKCEWEVGVTDRDDPDEWDWYHPRAKSEEEAKQLAKRSARGDGMGEPNVYEVYGPIKPRNPIQIGEEMIDEVFG